MLFIFLLISLLYRKPLCRLHGECQSIWAEEAQNTWNSNHASVTGWAVLTSTKQTSKSYKIVQVLRQEMCYLTSCQC